MTQNPTVENNSARRWSQLEDATRRNFADASAIVDSSDVIKTLEELLANRHPVSGKPVGRPRSLSVRTVCIAFACLALETKELTIENATRWINTLPDDLMSRLGLARKRGTDEVVNADSVGHMWNRIVELMNPSTTIEGKRVTLVDGDPVFEFRSKPLDRKARSKDVEVGAMKEPKTSRKISTRGQSRELDDDTIESRQLLLDQFSDALLQATCPKEWSIETVAIDWTDHESHAKKPTNGRTSADPDASYGRRHRKNPLSFAAGKAKSKAAKSEGSDGAAEFEPEKNEPFRGYNVHFLVNSGARSLPEIALSMRVTPANSMDTGPIAVDMVGSLLAMGQSEAGTKNAVNVVVDRGYSMRSAEKLHKRLAAMGVYLTFDYNKDDYGPHGTHMGAILIGGIPHCPAMPADVEYPRLPGPSATPADWEEYWRLWDLAHKYAFHYLGVPLPDLNARFQCPAKSKGVRCELCPLSQSIPFEKNVPEIYEPPAEALPACNKSFSVSVEIGLGLRQRYPHGSKEWTKAYDERTSVERFNGAFKAMSRVAPHDIKVLGLAKRTVMMTFATLAVNVCRLRAWDDAREEPSGVLGPRSEWDPWYGVGEDQAAA